MSPEVESERTKLIQSSADTLAQATDVAHSTAASTTNSSVVAHNRRRAQLDTTDKSGDLR